MLGTGNSRKAESSEQLQLSWGHGTCLDVWQEVFGWEGLWEGASGPKMGWFWRWLN